MGGGSYEHARIIPAAMHLANGATRTQGSNVCQGGPGCPRLPASSWSSFP